MTVMTIPIEVQNQIRQFHRSGRIKHVNDPIYIHVCYCKQNNLYKIDKIC